MPGLNVFADGQFSEYNPRYFENGEFKTPSEVYVFNGTEFVKIWPSFLEQQMNKVGRASFASATEAAITGWVSDTAKPSVVLNDSSFVVMGSIDEATVTAVIYAGRNETSGTPTVNLKLNGVTVDTTTIIPVSSFGSADPLRGRPTYLQWVGPLNEDDTIEITTSRTGSVTGYINEGSYIILEPGDTSVIMQRMYKNTSTYSLGNSRTVITGWTADARYPNSIVNSNKLSVSLLGAGTVRAYVVATNGSTTGTISLVHNGIDIGSVVIPSGDRSGYWIEVPDIIFDGSDEFWLEGFRGHSSFTRVIENNSPVIEAFVHEIPKIIRQRMNKVGDTGHAGIITGWISDSNYPANVVADKMVVSSSGLAVIRYGIWGSTANGNSSTISVYRNGVEIPGSASSQPGNGAMQLHSAEIPGITLIQGDQLEVRVSTVFQTAAIQAAGSYFEVAPTTIKYQRMDKVGTNGSSPISGWVAANADTVVADNRSLLVQGGGPVRIDAQIRATGNTVSLRRFEIFHNETPTGATMDLETRGHVVLSASVPTILVNEDDRIEIRQVSGGGFDITEPGFISVTPL